jgi:hypothetical protein
MKSLIVSAPMTMILSMCFAGGYQVFAQNITDTNDDCFKSNADFCGGADYIPNPNHKDKQDFTGNEVYVPNDKNDKGVYACNVITDSDKFCKKNLEKNIQKEKDNNKQSSGIGKITVGYGDVGSYYGKGKIVIKNLDTGKTLVTHDLNFAKQHHNQGDNCCVKVYTFGKSGTHEGDEIFAKVTGGGGSWESGTYNYTKNLKMTIDLDEIGE